MSENTHTKDWYVAQVVILTNENKRLRNELWECRKKMGTMLYLLPLGFGIGCFLARTMWRAF